MPETMIMTQGSAGVVMNININIEFRDFGKYVYRETLAALQEANGHKPHEEMPKPWVTVPDSATQGGEHILFGPAVLTFG